LHPLANVVKRLDDRVVLVTGASSGIGEALAREAAGRGARVVLLARREERLAALAAELGERALAVKGDVTREGSVEHAIESARERFGGVDVLFVNAGFGVGGSFRELSLDDYRRQFETNVFGALRSVKEALGELERRRGSVGIVGSVNGYVSIPGWSAYCMSKHALRSFSECLRLELLPRGVSVTHLAPGFVESEFRRVDNQEQWHAGAQDPVPPWLTMPAPRAARVMLDAVLARKAEAVITGHGKVAVGFARHAPAVVSGALRLGRGVSERFSKRG
jgi:NAD(P)-dependent dehydrogenase (short-subunit alcohol dehydrogenase family)